MTFPLSCKQIALDNVTNHQLIWPHQIPTCFFFFNLLLHSRYRLTHSIIWKRLDWTRDKTRADGIAQLKKLKRDNFIETQEIKCPRYVL